MEAARLCRVRVAAPSLHLMDELSEKIDPA